MPPRREYANMIPLQGGLVLPHYLDRQPEVAPTAEYGNLALRGGEVVELIWPTDARNISKRVLEYRVKVQHLDEGGVATTREYSNCTLLNTFGSLADRAVWTLRADGASGPEGLGKGAKVVLACLNGESASGIILGGLRDEHEAKTDSDTRSALGDHFLTWRFNGINVVVAADGTFSLTHNGPTDIDGAVPREKLHRSGFVMSPDGSLLLGSRNDPDGSARQLVRIDQAKRRVELAADDGVHVGTGTDLMLMGSTYRHAQTRYHDALQLLLDIVDDALGMAADALQSVATSMVVPLVGPVLAAPQVAVVAGQVKILREMVVKVNALIDTFEDGDATYLSDIHKIGLR